MEINAAQLSLHLRLQVETVKAELLKSLRPGATLSGRILEPTSSGGQVRIELGGTVVTAATDLRLQPGERLTFSVASAGDRPVLQILDAAGDSALKRELLRRALPRQLPLQQLLDRLRTALAPAPRPAAAGAESDLRPSPPAAATAPTAPRVPTPTPSTAATPTTPAAPQSATSPTQTAVATASTVAPAQRPATAPSPAHSPPAPPPTTQAPARSLGAPSPVSASPAPRSMPPTTAPPAATSPPIAGPAPGDSAPGTTPGPRPASPTATQPPSQPPSRPAAPDAGSRPATTPAPALPGAIETAARELLQRALPLERLLLPGVLRDAIAASGLLLEAQLAHGQVPVADFKLSLLRLLLRLGEAGARDGASGTARGEPGGAAIRGDLGGGALLRLLGELARHAEGALSRLQVHQLNSLPGDEGRQAWQFELPVADQGATDLFRLRVEGERSAEAEGAATGWSVEIRFDLDALGPVVARIGLRGETVSSFFWAERAATVARIENNLERLRAALMRAGLEVGQLGAHAGAPPPLPKRFSDGRGLLYEKA